MTQAPSRKLRGYLLLAAAGALLGLALGRPELVALVAPFAAYAAVGAAIARPPAIDAVGEIESPRVLEGAEITVTVQLDSPVDVHLVELELRPHRQVSVLGTRREPLALRSGEPREVRFVLRADRWGAYDVGAVAIRTHDRFGLIDYEASPLSLGPLRVFPGVEQLRALVDPAELQATVGSRVSRHRGEGIEFADIRPFLPGDRIRRINWRATARRGMPYVSERHPERNADVILLLDTYAEARDETRSTLARAVRAAAALAAAYLERRDRVGVLGFGGVLRGLGPRMGMLQLYRILDALIGSEVVFSYAQKDVRYIPRRLLPAKALVLAITPLIDERSIRPLLDLRARGFDLSIVEVSPLSIAGAESSPSAALAHRLWMLKRETLRLQFERLGVPVTEWREDEPLQGTLAEAAGLRRRGMVVA